MRLKEAFTLQNKIQYVYKQAIQLIRSETFANREVIHMYSKANIGEDASEQLPVDTYYLAGEQRYQFDKLVDLAQAILEDKQLLTAAIEKAKLSYDDSYDAIKQGNVVKSELISALGRLEDLKSNQVDGRDVVYGKDNEGKPASYQYPTKTITTYDIDKAHLKSILKRLRSEFDEASLKLDEMSLTIDVDFTPKFDYDSSVEQIYLES